MKKRGLVLLSMLCGAVLLSGCFAQNNNNANQQSSSNKGNSAQSSSVVEEKTYKITFKQDGYKDIVKEVKEGKDLTNIPKPQDKEGYTVVWEDVDLTDIQSNLTVHAEETANEYTVTYDANGGTVTPSTQKVTYDSEPEFAKPTKEGFEFVAWNYNGKPVTGVWKTAKDVTIVAEWVEIKKEKVTVSFVQEGQETVSVEINKGGSVAESDIPALVSPAGYTAKWDKKLPASITENITLTAVYTANTYTITYDAKGGTVTPASQEVTYDGEVTLAVPTRAEYEFVAWTYEGKAVATDKWKIADNVTLEAEWKAIPKYTVTFVQANQENVEVQVLKGGSVAESDIPALIHPTGYTAKWDKALPETITEPITLTAVYTANTYTITYDAKGGTVTPASQEVTYGDKVTLAVPQREGYTFVAWTYEGKAVNTEKWDIAKAATLVAEWKEIVIIKYTVSFVQNGFETIQIEVNEGGSLTEADIPDPQQKKGYVIAWENVDLTNIQGNITVKAVETVKTYTIILNANGGTVSNTSIKISYGEAYTLPTPTNGDKTFQGWKYNGETISLNGTWDIDAKEDITLVASWRDDNWTNNY